MMLFTLETVQKALSVPHFEGQAAQQKMVPSPRRSIRPPQRPGQARLGAVLVLLYYRDAKLYLVLTRRPDSLDAHAGQISFPGGRHEAPETLEMTALRETHEEVGVSPAELTVLGELTPLYIYPSDFEVHPFVAWYSGGGRPHFVPDEREVAEIIEVPLHHLLDAATRKEETWEIRGIELQVPYFQVQEHKVWGATAMMLSEFLERLRLVEAAK